MFQSIVTSMPMFVSGVLSVLLALSLHHRWDKPRFRLLIFMVTTTLLYLAHYIFFNHILEAIPFSDTVYCFCNPAVYPLYLIYIEELTLHRPDRSLQFVILLPAIVCSLAVGGIYMLMNAEETTLFITDHLYHDHYASLSGIPWLQGMAHLAVKITFAIQIPPVLTIGLRHIKRYNKIVEANYSDTEGKTLTPIRTLLVLFVVVSLLSFLCNIIGRYRFTDSSALLAFPSITFSLLILLIGHIGLQQDFHIQNITDSIEAEESSKQQQPQNERQALSENLRRLVEAEHIYLQPNLKLEDLAKHLNTNRAYIYNVINTDMGMSFSEYINRKRIEHATRLIEQNPNLLLADIATMSGFSSISAFYRNFKLYKHCSPSEYQLHKK